MKTKRIISCLVLILSCTTMYAQSYEEYRKAYNERRQQYAQTVTNNYNSFRDSINLQFADFMREKWVEKSANSPIPMPAEPKPLLPVILQPEEEEPVVAVEDVVSVPDEPIVNRPFDGLKTPIDVAPVVDIQMPTQPQYDFYFDYYGTDIFLPIGDKHRFDLRKADENSVAEAWERLAGDEYTPLLDTSLALRSELQMSDWGYVRFAQKASEAFLGKSNEAVVLQMFLLTNSGYMVRMARVDERLILLLPSMAEIWQYRYLTIGDYKYYMIDDNPGSKCYLLEYAFPNEKPVSLEIAKEQLFEYQATDTRYLQGAGMLIGLNANKNLIDFYADYPLNNTLALYAESPLYSMAKYQLYPSLRVSIEGLSQLDAANLLLNFVQTSFEYKTDGEQFGNEKPMFTDEILFYPYCDCEDRSFLFARLVHDLLGLDVVLLDYPGHIATAVCFTDEEVAGTYFQIDGLRYTVCDPTYINAPVGRAMPGLSSAEIIRITL